MGAGGASTSAWPPVSAMQTDRARQARRQSSNVRERYPVPPRDRRRPRRTCLPRRTGEPEGSLRGFESNTRSARERRQPPPLGPECRRAEVSGGHTDASNTGGKLSPPISGCVMARHPRQRLPPPAERRAGERCARERGRRHHQATTRRRSRVSAGRPHALQPPALSPAHPPRAGHAQEGVLETWSRLQHAE